MDVLVGTNHRVKILEVTRLAIKLGLRSKKATVNVDGMNILKGKSTMWEKIKGMVWEGH